VICDTSGLIAALAADQPLSEECVSAMEAARDLVISPLVLTELDHLVGRRHGQHLAIAVMRELSSGGYNIAEFGASELALAAEVMTTYADLRLGLVDASLVVLAKRFNTNEILTLDQRHFRVVRSLSGRHFKLLPFDME
jgi:predicted nucleic acid-binding protein